MRTSTQEFDRLRQYGMTMAQLLGAAALIMRNRLERPADDFWDQRSAGWLEMYDEFVLAEAQHRRRA